MKFLSFLNILAELIQLVFEIGVFTRQYFIPVCVYVYVWIEHYIAPTMMIPYYYFKVRKLRLECVN